MKKVLLLSTCLFMLFPYVDANNLPAPASTFATGFSALGITVAGGNGEGASSNQLQFPNGIFIDQAGNIYVADGSNNRIQKWAPGAATGITVAEANQPGDVFVDLAGNIYASERANHRIRKWAPGASSGVTVAGGNGQGEAANQFSYPSGIFVDAAGNIYIADVLNSRIQKWAPGASAGSTVAGGHGDGAGANQLSSPTSIFVDPAGNIYVSDGGNYRIQKWAPGALAGITVAGGNNYGPAANQILPSDVFVDAAGILYVTDLHNDRIQKWTPGATEGITIAGGNFKGAGADQFNYPGSVFLDQTGNMYVSDGRNHRVQKFLADNSTTCLPNLIFTVPTCSGTTAIQWNLLHDTFPATIDIPEELDLLRGKLYYLGASNGHGYYQSSIACTWAVAKDISFYIGDTSAKGHLLTIGSAAENSFIFNLVKGTGFSPWIGFSNTGKQGQFSWVNGEANGYTNWAPNEPNNAPGNPKFIREPYVRLTGSNGTWNDQRSDNIPFMTEFDEPLIRYRQISGPANGSVQPVGVYQVCYEITNSISGEKTNCCFNVTVNCPNSPLSTTNGNSAADKNIISATNGGLRIITSPNPSSNYFRLKISSGNVKNSIELKVTDLQGRVVENRKVLQSDQALQIGEHYRPGIYLAQVTQGSEKVVVRIVKQ